MSFDIVESSIDNAVPFELYEFNYGLKYYRYTTLPHIVTYLNNEFLPMPLSRDSINLTDNFRKAQIHIKAPKDFEVSELFKKVAPNIAINVKIFKKHITDAEVIVQWVGRVMDAVWTNSDVTLTCESIYSILQNNSSIRHYSVACPHLLYGEDCGVNMLDYEAVLSVLSVSGNVLVCENVVRYTADYFTGGLAKWEGADGIELLRFVIKHTPNTTNNLNTIELSQNIYDLAEGDTVKLYPGCNRTREMCLSKFNNEINYGGFLYLPERNPFTSSSNIYD